MFSSFPTQRNRNRNGLIRRCWVLLTCVMLLPIPVPIAHRHDAYESPEKLACHVALRHSEPQQVAVDRSETHWHFTIPSRKGHDHDEPSDHQPPTSTDYIGGQTASTHFLCGKRLSENWAGDLALGYQSPLPGKLIVDPLRLWLIESAQHEHRCALSCVMRC